MTTAPSQPSLPAPLRVSQMIVSLWVPQALHAAAELGIPDLLAESPRSAAAVAAALGTHADATERLLRALLTLGLLVKNGDCFELTDTGRCLEAGSAGSRRAWARLMGGTAVWGAWGQLADCVRTGKKAYGGAAAAESDVFELLAADPAMAEIFNQAMADSTTGAAPSIVAAIDWTGVRRVVDVGGGFGALLCAILQSNPELEGTVFDLEHARPGALRVFEARGLMARARYEAGSFFETPPPPAEVYVLKSVIHDWDDEASLRILGRCREAMQETSRLLLVEPPAGSPSGNPVGDWFSTFSDLNMLVNTGGRERTEAEYTSLLERAAMRVVAVRETGTFFRVFEAVRG